MTEKGLSQKLVKSIQSIIGLITGCTITISELLNWMHKRFDLLPMREADLKRGIGMALFFALLGWFFIVRRRIHIAWVGGVGVLIFVLCYLSLVLTDRLWKTLGNLDWGTFITGLLQPLIWGLGYATIGTIVASIIVSVLQRYWHIKSLS